MAEGLLRALERRVDDMSQEVSAQVSSAVAALQEELLQLLHAQQEELRKLRVQQQHLQESMAVQVQRPVLEGDVQATGALESQLRDLVSELRGMRQDPNQKADFPAAAVAQAAQQLQAEVVSADAVVMLKELREERALVTEMLDNVKQEKCEVIAMMHTFAMSKGEAIDELEGIRRAACEEAMAAASLVRKVVGNGGQQAQEAVSNGVCGRHSQEVISNEACGRLSHEGPPTCRSAVRDAGREEREEERLAHQPVLLQGRQGSRTSLCPATLQQQASAPVTLAGTAAPPQHPGVAMGHSVPMQGSVQHTVVISTAQGMMQNHDHRRHSTGTGPGEPPLRRVCSPTRQYSAGGAAGLLPVSVACSPPMLPRPTTTLSQPGDQQKSPVRRFISAGLSPRVQDTLGPSPGWAAMSQAALIR